LYYFCPTPSIRNFAYFIANLFTATLFHPVRTADFDYPLPPELIAQHPASTRDASRLLVLHRDGETLEHCSFPDLLNYLRRGDVLVLNDSKVLPARLRARNESTGGAFEILLLEEVARNDWWAMMRPAKRARPGTTLTVLDQNAAPAGIAATVAETNAEGHRRLQFACDSDVINELESLGEMPLPPYIRRLAGDRSPEDIERYQTVYARAAGSVAAPTAGLHFTEQLMSAISARGVQICYVTLHVGLGTFAPVKAEETEKHVMHHERFVVSTEMSNAINAAKSENRRVVAVGTTTVRVLETVARENDGKIAAGAGRTNIFIHPPAQFRVIDALVTNFHLPQSTLLMLVSAFASPGKTTGREVILRAYAEAVRERYSFFSYGDAMLIL
jgi:S-adenosylmethionine:tRNA ribosyltransferase-isomerase